MLIFSYSSIKLYQEDKSSYILEASLDNVSGTRREILGYLGSMSEHLYYAYNLSQLRGSKLKKMREDVLSVWSLDQSGNYKQLFTVDDQNSSLPEEIKQLAEKVGKISNSFYHFLDESIVVLLPDQKSDKVVISLLDNQQIKKILSKNSYFKNFIIENGKVEPTFNKDIYPFAGQSILDNFKDSRLDSSLPLEADGKVILTTVGRISGTSFSIVSTILKKNAFRATNVLIQRNIYFTLFVFLVALAVGLYFSATILNPLNILKRAADRISHGELDKEIIVNSGDEIELLAESMDNMQNQIVDLLEETKEKARIDSELKIASSVQDTLFPEPDFSNEAIQLHGFNSSASECGGDWWTYQVVNNKLFFCVFDATGHGVGPALVTSAVASATFLMLEQPEMIAPNVYLTNLNDVVSKVSKGKINATCFCGVYDFATSVLSYSNAAHTHPIIFRSGEVVRIEQDLSGRLGEENCPPFTLEQMTLQKGDVIFNYTDGITDRESDKGTKLGERRMIKKIGQFVDGGAAGARDDLADFVMNYSKRPIPDDITFSFTQLM